MPSPRSAAFGQQRREQPVELEHPEERAGGVDHGQIGHAVGEHPSRRVGDRVGVLQRIEFAVEDGGAGHGDGTLSREREAWARQSRCGAGGF